MKYFSIQYHRRGAIAAVLVLAAAVTATAAQAEESSDDAFAELTQAKNSVEVGAGSVSDGSFKFGEYNGLHDRGALAVGTFDLRGGAKYGSSDTTRWHVRGADLGLDTRSFSAEYGKQGQYRLNVGYDELRRSRSDSYQTGYLGAGSATLTLPASWIAPTVPRVSATAINARGLSSTVAASSALVNGILTAPTAAQLATSNALIAADLAPFRHYDLYTKRGRYDAGLSVVFAKKWDFAIGARRENKNGAKPMGSVTRSTGGDISTILPDPIDQTTDQFNITLGYRSKADSVQLAYNASKFSNAITALTWTNWAAPTTNMTMSSAPGNKSQQLLLTARHDFSPATRLVFTGSNTRNTQDAAFLTDASTPLVPVNSLHGLVVTDSYSLRLTSRPQRKLNLAVGYKYDARDNRTPIHTYAYYDANEPAGAANIDAAFATALGVPAALLKSNANVNANRPYSRRLSEFNAEADIHIAATQSLKASVDWQKIHRWCGGSWIDCMDAADTTERLAGLAWRADPSARVSTRISYSYTARRVDAYNENAFLALVPMAQVSPSTATGGASAYSFMLQNGWNGYGPVAGLATTTGNMNLFFPLNNALANASYQNANRISELNGMRRYNMADRNRNRLRADLDWQPAEKWSLHGNVDFYKDDYGSSRYGLIDARDWATSVEGSFIPGEDLAFTVFVTHEVQRQRSAGNSYTANNAATSVNGLTAISGGCYATIALRNASNKIDPCLNWSTDMQNQIDLYGASMDRKGLLSRKLDLGAQLVISRARSDNSVTGGNYANNPLAVTGAAASTVAAYFIAAEQLPTVVTDSLELRLNARYTLSHASMLRLQYIYGDLSSTDYAYEGMQAGGLAGVLPSLETAPHYVVHVIALSYAHRF
jgi:MtrB/PioB family decaheme-associated outer membrane protein